MRRTREFEDRQQQHRLRGVDRVGYSSIAECSCGWSSKLLPGEERAFVAFWRHRASGWFRRSQTATS